MAPISTSFLKRCAPPVFAHTASEKYLAEQAAKHSITWLDLAIGMGILSDFVLSLVSITITHWYVGAIEIVLSLYLLALLGVRSMRPLVGRLLLAGFIAGLCELFTDASGQYAVHSLIYPAGALT